MRHLWLIVLAIVVAFVLTSRACSATAAADTTSPALPDVSSSNALLVLHYVPLDVICTYIPITTRDIEQRCHYIVALTNAWLYEQIEVSLKKTKAAFPDQEVRVKFCNQRTGVTYFINLQGYARDNHGGRYRIAPRRLRILKEALDRLVRDQPKVVPTLRQGL